MKIEEVIASPAPLPDRPQIPPPPVHEPDRDDVEYLAWRQELL